MNHCSIMMDSSSHPMRVVLRSIGVMSTEVLEEWVQPTRGKSRVQCPEGTRSPGRSSPPVTDLCKLQRSGAIRWRVSEFVN